MNPEIYKLLQTVKQLGKKVILSSNGPYSKSLIIQLLKEKDVFTQLYDQLFVHNTEVQRKSFYKNLAKNVKT